MNFDEFIKLLICPITKEPLELAPESLLISFNKNSKTKIRKGLVNTSKTYLYPIINEIPVLLSEEACKLVTVHGV